MSEPGRETDGEQADELSDLERVLLALHPQVEISGRLARAVFRPQPEHRGNPGWLHGGLAATVLDHVCARAASAALEDKVVTGKLDLRYPQPVMLFDGPYRVEATAEEPRGRTIKVAGAILGQDGRPMVEAQSLFVAFNNGERLMP